ncbi:MAG: response regulator transcription factor [Lachnospirales bacterium]
MAKKVLIVDDEKLIVKGIKFALSQDGYETNTAYDGQEALDLAKSNNYDLVILDVMLPNLDGLQVCQMIREFSTVPIIMLTAKDADMDKIMGLEYGADDYLTKPFNILELKARIKAIFRRSGSGSKENLEVKIKVRDLEIDTDSKRTFVGDEEVNLTSKEFDLLVLFMTNVERVYSREKLLDTIWGKDHPGDVRTVDVHVRRLREKIETKPSKPQFIHTKWGVGYYFK